VLASSRSATKPFLAREMDDKRKSCRFHVTAIAFLFFKLKRHRSEKIDYFISGFREMNGIR
jgi:hypothetical protein